MSNELTAEQIEAARIAHIEMTIRQSSQGLIGIPEPQPKPEADGPAEIIEALTPRPRKRA